MPTIAEIIAARAKGATAPSAPFTPATATPAAQRQTLAEAVAAKEAIDRIDAPGKQQRATAARQSAGLVIRQALPATDPRPEVPRAVTQPSNDQPMCVVIEGRTVWLCMPCEDPAAPPIRVLRLPLTVWPHPAAPPLPEGEPF